MKKLWWLGVVFFLFISAFSVNGKENIIDAKFLVQNKLKLVESAVEGNIVVDEIDELVHVLSSYGMINSRKINDKIEVFTIKDEELYLYIAYNCEDKRGKLMLSHKHESMKNKILRVIKEVKNLEIENLDYNYKYKIDTNRRNINSNIQAHLNLQNIDYDEMEFERGTEFILIDKKWFQKIKRIHMVTISYGENSYFIVGSKNIFIEY